MLNTLSAAMAATKAGRAFAYHTVNSLMPEDAPLRPNIAEVCSEATAALTAATAVATVAARRRKGGSSTPRGEGGVGRLTDLDIGPINHVHVMLERLVTLADGLDAINARCRHSLLRAALQEVESKIERTLCRLLTQHLDALDERAGFDAALVSSPGVQDLPGSFG